MFIMSRNPRVSADAAFMESSKNHYDDFLELVQKYKVIFEDYNFKNYENFDEDEDEEEEEAQEDESYEDESEEEKAARKLAKAKERCGEFIFMPEVCESLKNQAEATNAIYKIIAHIDAYTNDETYEEDFGNFASSLCMDARAIKCKIEYANWWRFSYDELEKSAAKVLEFFSTYEYIKNERKAL